MRISDWSSDVCSSDLEQSETIARQIGAILDDSPVVETAFYDVSVGGGNAFLTLKKHRDMPSVEWERSVQPKLAAIPDARVSFQSQSGGFSRSEEHTSELQSLMRISYAVFCLKKKNKIQHTV